jgi:peptide/nickel transport system permease protein
MSESSLATEMAVSSNLPASPSFWLLTWRQFRKHKLSMAGAALLLVFVTAAILAPLLPEDPNIVNLELDTRLTPPSAEHWFGTDHLGRDIFTRTVYGGRISLAIGFLATGLAVGLGTLFGSISGYFGGTIDNIMMRIIDVLFSLPILFLIIILQSLVERPSIYNVMLVLALTSWMSPARLVRGEILKEREMEYIQASRALGASSFSIIVRHLLPNVIGPVIVTATLRIGRVIILESALSYLGFGTQPPTSSWGAMLAQARDYLATGIWYAIFPGFFLSLTVLAFNFVGDGLAAAVNPHERK